MYLTLPNNASQNIYAENTTSDLTVHLPKTLDFVGPWNFAIRILGIIFPGYQTISCTTDKTQFLLKQAYQRVTIKIHALS